MLSRLAVLFLFFVLKCHDLQGYRNPEANFELNSALRDEVMGMPHMVELQYSETVQEYIELYRSEYRHIYGRMLARAELYFPIIDQYLDKYQLPRQLRYLPAIESAMKPYAISRSRAVGLWQIMSPVGRYYQLRIDDTVDERRDPYKSTDVAMAYLSSLYDQFEDWTLAVAAYNCGPGRMRKAIRESGSRNFWELQAFLPRETQRYIPKFIAFTYLFQNGHRFSPEKEYPIPVEAFSTEYTVLYNSLSFDEIADLAQVEKDIVEYLNPAFLKKRIPSNSEGYLLILPENAMTRFLGTYWKDGLDTVYNDIVPRYNVIPRYKTQRSVYRVSSGDNLYVLARRFDCSVNELKRWNYLSSNLIHPGQFLNVVCRAIDLIPMDRWNGKAEELPVQISEVSRAFSPLVLANSGDHFRAKSAVKYHVLDGRESLVSIAAQYSGIEPEDIVKHNHLGPQNKPREGMVLRIVPN
ncbi:MAG TPA: transglycosylase SLT domain-containing protein [Saprospiraceae bacterium]|nr:transglycosylase SLT domain-containing protein [Saprospiraceae bacterium]